MAAPRGESYQNVQRGTCLWFDQQKGFGFISPEDASVSNGDNIFVHHTEIHARAFRSLANGEPVEFSVVQDEKGRRKAVNVTGPGGAFVQGSSPQRQNPHGYYSYPPQHTPMMIQPIMPFYGNSGFPPPYPYPYAQPPAPLPSHMIHMGWSQTGNSSPMMMPTQQYTVVSPQASRRHPSSPHERAPSHAQVNGYRHDREGGAVGSPEPTSAPRTELEPEGDGTDRCLPDLPPALLEKILEHLIPSTPWLDFNSPTLQQTAKQTATNQLTANRLSLVCRAWNRMVHKHHTMFRSKVSLRDFGGGTRYLSDVDLIPVLHHCRPVLTLDLGNAQALSGAILSSLAFLQSLNSLAICNSHHVCTGLVSNIVNQCRSIVSLSIASCPYVNDECLACLHVLRLLCLDVSDCPLVTDTGALCIAQQMPHLVSLSLAQTQVTDTGVKAIAFSCSSLATLILNGCALVGPDCINELRTLQRLTSFSASCCPLLSGDCIARFLCPLPSGPPPPLHTLTIRSIPLSLSEVSLLLNSLPSLRELDIRDCGLTFTSLPPHPTVSILCDGENVADVAAQLKAASISVD